MFSTLTPLPPLDGFRHAAPIQIRWGDLDALGHVNNANYLTYLEQARISYFTSLALWDGSAGTVGPIMARCEIDYRMPLRADDTVIVYTRCVRLGTRSFDTEQVIARATVRPAGKTEIEVAAQSKIVLVVYDYTALRSTPMPEMWREQLRAFEVVPPTE
ncbi:MAG: thioesterase family protein [Chloroflexota bacterium]|nr:thioesterase family protein [Chloroflexota bacterium]